MAPGGGAERTRGRRRAVAAAAASVLIAVGAAVRTAVGGPRRQSVPVVELVLLGLDEVPEEVVVAEVGVVDQALEVQAYLGGGQLGKLAAAPVSASRRGTRTAAAAG